MPKLLFSYVLYLLIIRLSHGQGYKIEVNIKGTQEQELLLGYYFSGKTYAKDTAFYLGKGGDFLFSGEEPLDKGMYFLAQNGSLLSDLVIGEDQFFTLKTSSEAFIDSMEVEGDKDNQLFFDNMRFNVQRNYEAAPFIGVLRDSTSTEEAKTEAQNKFEAINNKVEAYVQEIIDKHPNSIIAAILGANKRPRIPDEVEIDDQEARFSYHRDHFWDSIDLGNPVLLRLSTPIYKQKVDDYLDNLIRPVPDDVKKVVDKLVDIAKKDEETYQYMVWHLTIKYQTSKIMSFDEVYVHLVDKYFLTGEMDFWANDQLKSNLKEKADQLRSSLIGMVAPNLVLQGLDKKPKSLYDLPNKYSVIYFYDPDCGHCKKETPVLKAFIDSTSFDVGVYTVSADTSMTKMNNYIEEMALQDWINTNGTRTYGVNYQQVYDAFTTPTIYLLNEKKEIIAKKIKASQLERVLTNHEKMEKRESN
ncbi:MAG: DUF5106 domain-containing protein [Bacteroidota bacterium]